MHERHQPREIRVRCIEPVHLSLYLSISILICTGEGGTQESTDVYHSCCFQTYGQFTLWSVFTGNWRNVLKIVSIFHLIQLQVMFSSFREHQSLI